MRLILLLALVACSRASNDANPSAGGSAAPPSAQQISVDTPDPVVAIDAAEPAAPVAIDAAAAPIDAGGKVAIDAGGKVAIDAASPDAGSSGALKPKQACTADADCVLTMIPAEPACCRSLCQPRAIPKATLPGLETKQKARDCKAVLCAPPAPCPRPKKYRAVCKDSQCVEAP